MSKVNPNLPYAHGLGPLREPDMAGPVRASDFCGCARGREGWRWWNEGLRMLPAISEAISDCAECEPTTGLILWQGWNGANGVTAFLEPMTPPFLRDEG